MLPFAQFNEELVLNCIDEFSGPLGRNGPFAITCLDQSADFPTQRMVFLLTQEDRPTLVLKLDSAPNSTRLTKEFHVLEDLQKDFAESDRLSVIAPLYLAPQGHFHLTEHASGKTAKQKIYADPPPAQAGQTYRRGGEWLHRLHGTQPLDKETLWLNWMLEEIENQRNLDSPQADGMTLDRYVTAMHKDLSRFQDRQDTQVFSHGDFHGGNIILAQGKTFGLDFTEANRKLAVYDIVDYLKMDVFAHSREDQVGPDGILLNSRAMFLKTYRHSIDPELLTYCLRGRLLIDWVKISEDKYQRSAFLRKKFSCLLERLERAFAQPLSLTR